MSCGTTSCPARRATTSPPSAWPMWCDFTSGSRWLRRAEGPFDVIFNDIDKQDYPKALDVIVTKLRSGGLLLVDNMLWSGRIFERRDTSPATRGVRELTRRIQTDPRWIASVIPVRDGLLVAHRASRRTAAPAWGRSPTPRA